MATRWTSKKFYLVMQLVLSVTMVYVVARKTRTENQKLKEMAQHRDPVLQKHFVVITMENAEVIRF